tara:strand:- start:315 stop:1559 length:1245 start_codon:yes stop_codon:yes gene_type:complete
MPKKRQIPFLHSRTLADGSTAYDWKPSKALKEAGWPHVSLGTDHADACRQALDINARIAAWRQGKAPATSPAGDGPRLVRWDGLIARYRKSRDYRDLKPSTQKEYDSRIRWLTTWALDGELIVRQIDATMVQDLKRALEEGGSSDHRTSAIMRVLRLLLSFAEREGIIPKKSNPARDANIREPRSRRHVLSLEAVQALAARAEAEGLPNVALAIQLGFWTVQRQGDLLGSFNRMAWRKIDNVERRDAALLAGKGGNVMGFRLQQEKTGAWVDAPVPPFLHDTIEAAWLHTDAEVQTLLRDDDEQNGAKALPDWRLQRHWRALRDACAADAREAGRLILAEELARGQFRDLRRSGQVYMRDAGAKKEWITSLSGHTILAKKSILDTYMPGDTAAACAAVAQALRHYNRQMKEKAG